MPRGISVHESRKEPQLWLHQLWHLQLGLLGIISPYDPGLLGELIPAGKHCLCFFSDIVYMGVEQAGDFLCDTAIVKTLSRFWEQHLSILQDWWIQPALSPVSWYCFWPSLFSHGQPWKLIPWPPQSVCFLSGCSLHWLHLLDFWCQHICFKKSKNLFAQGTFLGTKTIGSLSIGPWSMTYQYF